MLAIQTPEVYKEKLLQRPASMTTSIFKEPLGLRYNGAALLYVVVAYMTGLAGLFHPSRAIKVVAVLLLAHSMIIAAYLIHDCGHQMVSMRSRHNARLGRAMSWLCGAAYGNYEDMRYKYFRHHVDNDDVVWFEYEQFFENHPLVLKVTQALEWFYVPAHDLSMHFIMVFTSFIIPQRRDQRVRNVAVIAVRGAVFMILVVLFPVVAYLLMMHVLRFMDSLQHDYPTTRPCSTMFNRRTRAMMNASRNILSVCRYRCVFPG